MGTLNAHDAQEFDYSWEKLAVAGTCIYWIAEVLNNNEPETFEDPIPDSFIFWAWGDTISGPLYLPGITACFDPVDAPSTQYTRDERTYLTCPRHR